MKERKAIFLDKDGTIVPDVPYNVNPALISLEKGVIEGLKLLKEAGYIFVIISNQAGVAKGYFTIDKLEKVKKQIDFLLEKESLLIEAYYFCPHHTEGKVSEYSIVCECRKPKPGMLLRAAKELNISLQHSWMIGDILNDTEAGNCAGCNTILIDNGNETEWVKGPFRSPTYVAADFLLAANYMLNHPRETKYLHDKNLAAL